MSEAWLLKSVSTLELLVEAAGALVIFVGVLVGFCRFGLDLWRRRDAKSYTSIRLYLGRILALGLEFQLASDLLRTAVAPSFEEIGKLAAIAAIRTALNFFLNREIEAERRELDKSDDSGLMREGA